MCVARYENSGKTGYRDLITSAADAYLDSEPPEDADAWPMTYGHAISLELAAWRSTAQPRWREGYSKCKRETEHEASRGRYRGDHDRFPDDAEVNPLQRASVIVEGELDQSLTFGAPSTETVDPDDGERDGEEQDEPEARRGH